MQSAIHAILLAGVHQWRPSVFERWLPRTLVPIANRPLISYPLSWLRDGGMRTVHVCANSDTHTLRHELGGGNPRGMQLSYYEDIMPRGPAGCVADAAGDSRADVFLILDASIMPQSVPIKELISAHANSGAAMTIVANKVSESAAQRSGIQAVGIYVCARRVLQFIPASGYQDIKEMLIPRLYEAGEVVAVFETDAYVPRVKGAGSYLGANQLAISRLIETEETPDCHERHGSAIVHDTADIEAGARICGPVLIGERSSVSKNAVIVGPVSIGANCRVGEGSHVCRSILWDQVSVGSGAFVDQSILMHSAGVAAEAQVTRRIQHRTRLAKALRG